MRKFLISLAKDTQRRELFFSQPDSIGFEAFSAINTMDQDWEALATQFDLKAFEQHYGRQVTKGEIGCTLSHLAVYQQIAEDANLAEDAYVLICEDDAYFNKNFAKSTALLAQQCDSAIVLVGQSKILYFNDIELEINYPTTFGIFRHSLAGTKFKYAFPYKSYFAGTVGYLIKKSAAKIFLQQVAQFGKPFWLADDFLLFETQFSLQNKVVRPLLVIENPTLTSNLEAIRGSKANPFLKKLLKYPFKKLLAIKKNF